MVRFIDLFAGMGGIRKGLEQAFNNMGVETTCVLTSEIKPSAIEVLRANHPNEVISGDICSIPSTDIPNFDILLGGFPCQAFSAAGKRKGFMDTRGTLFFEVERILRDKKPFGFILENVEGLVNHDKVEKNAPMGRTLETILYKLEELGYNVNWKVLNSKDFGVAQERKRIIIVGTLTETISLDNFPQRNQTIGEILDYGQDAPQSKLAQLLLAKFTPNELYGKSIKDKRGGESNIHSWDLGLKGYVSKEQATLLNILFKERRKKKWALEIGIDWMDGMPLTLEQIYSFYPKSNLKEMLDDLVSKGYLKLEHPKKKVIITNDLGSSSYREQDESLPKGYNIVAGKLSYDINKILDPNGIAPTMVAMDMQKNYVIDGNKLRRLTLREGLRLFGYPEDFQIPINENKGYDLLGNTVVIPLIRAVAERLCEAYLRYV